jgi:hypothetical protein
VDDREYELKQLELTLKEREVSAREREVAAKEREPRPSQWTNPLVISLLVAALALGGNILTNVLSNRASDKAEHVRAQTSLVLEVAKTGNKDDECKNLNFFVDISFLDDPSGTIRKLCGTQSGVPTLPASTTGIVENRGGAFSSGLGSVALLYVQINDADSHAPIANAKVSVERTSEESLQSILSNGLTGGSRYVAQSSSTNATGMAVLNSVYSFDILIVSKDGYETVTQPLSKFNLGGQLAASVPIELHRVPASKH